MALPETLIPASLEAEIALSAREGRIRCDEIEAFTVRARFRLNAALDPIIGQGVEDTGEDFVKVVKQTAGAGKTAWPVWRSSPTPAQRRAGSRPRPANAGPHSRDRFKSIERDSVRGWDSWWLGILNDTAYANALEKGAPHGGPRPGHNWRRPAGKFLARKARQVLKPNARKNVRDRVERQAATAIRREIADANRARRRR